MDRFKNIVYKIQAYIGSAWQEFRSDLKHASWMTILGWPLIVSIVLSLLGFICLLVRLPSMIDSNYGLDFPCRPDNSFNPNDTYNFWRPNDPFEVTIAAGDLNFSQAKLIDVIWDMVVARAFQILLSLIAYRVLRSYVTAQVAISPISIPAYKSLFLNHNPSLGSTIGLIKHFVKHRALRSRLGMIWIVFSAIFLFSYPVMLGAMTSYQSKTAPFVNINQNSLEPNLVPFESLRTVDYVIRDGSRLTFMGKNLNDNYVVTPFSNRTSMRTWRETFMIDKDVCQKNFGNLESGLFDCYLRSNISQYVSRYGFLGLNDTETSFCNETLASPSLNVTAFYIDPGDSIFGHDWQMPGSSNYPFQNPYNQTFYYPQGNPLVLAWNLNLMTMDGTCQPTNGYRWGFSFILLFIHVVLLFIWIIGTILLWKSASICLNSQEKKTIIGDYKAMLEIASTLHDNLAEQGKDLDKMTEDQMKDFVEVTIQGGSIPIYASTFGGEARLWSAFVSWFKTTDKWWILAGIVLSGSLSTAAIIPLTSDTSESITGSYIALVLSITTFIGIKQALFLGKTFGSRICLVGLWTLVGLLIGVIVGSSENSQR